MSDDSPFGDFSSEQQQPAQTFDDEDQQPIIALPPPTEDGEGAGSRPQDDEDDFGVSESSPSAAAAGGETADPFATVDGGSSENAGAYDSFSNQPQEVKEEEAAALKAWERERATVLADRQAKASADKAAQLKAAKDEVSKFYADRDATVTKQQKTNRADEKNYRSDMKATFESGARWEKVNKLVTIAPKANEKAGTSRVDRMRKVLIQLKAEKKA